MKEKVEGEIEVNEMNHFPLVGAHFWDALGIKWVVSIFDSADFRLVKASKASRDWRFSSSSVRVCFLEEGAVAHFQTNRHSFPPVATFRWPSRCYLRV